MFKYLKEVINNTNTGKPSSRRFALVAATLFIGVSLVIATAAICLGQDVSYMLIWAFTLPLSLLAGASYSSVEISKIKNPIGAISALADKEQE